MASTTSRSENLVECPLCSDYTGPPSSVEAHISRKTDPVHQGEVGRAHRDHLLHDVDSVVDESTSEKGVDSDVESTSEKDVDGDGGSSTTRGVKEQWTGGDGVGERDDPTEDRVEVEAVEDTEQQDEDTREVGQEGVEERDGQEERGGGADHAEAGKETYGIPIPVSSQTLILVVVVALIIVLLVSQTSTDEGEQSEDQQSTQQREDSVDEMVENIQGGGGLIG